MKSKRYLLYAMGEIILIVVGILLALYINNRNVNQQYKSTIDNNILRVYDELEKNIDKTRGTIERLQYKDSLIYLFMNDSLTDDDYYKNIDLAYLIVQTHPLNLEDRAYKNLINLNVSDNRYQDDLLNDLTQLYSINKKVQDLNNKMSDFVYKESIPLLAKNIDSFGDLTYKSVIQEDALNYFKTSSEYQAFVGQYAIVLIQNQLQINEKFYKKAIGVYNEISERYDLINNYKTRFNQSTLSKYEGQFAETKIKDTINITYKNDSLFLGRGKKLGINLIPLDENRFFIYREVRGEFVSFFKDTLDNSDWNLRIHLLSNRWTLEKID